MKLVKKIQPKMFIFTVVKNRCMLHGISDFIWDFGKLPFPLHLGKFFKELGKKIPKIHKIGKIKTILRLGMTPLAKWPNKITVNECFTSFETADKTLFKYKII